MAMVTTVKKEWLYLSSVRTILPKSSRFLKMTGEILSRATAFSWCCPRAKRQTLNAKRETIFSYAHPYFGYALARALLRPRLGFPGAVRAPNAKR
jgi:hypothetical protein